MMQTILPMKITDCDKVAVLHIQNLRGVYREEAGSKILQCYYSALVQSRGGCGYVAIMNGELVGYICGVWDWKLIRERLLYQYILKLAAWGLVQILTYPGMILQFRNRAIRGNPAGNENRMGYELRPIVVAPAARRHGIGAQLIHTLVEDARGRNFDRIFLFTEHDNEPAKRLYQNFGFQLVGKEQLNSTYYLRYELPLSRS